MCKPHKANGSGEKSRQKRETSKLVDEGLELAEDNIPAEILAYTCDICNHILDYCECEVPVYMGPY